MRQADRDPKWRARYLASPPVKDWRAKPAQKKVNGCGPKGPGKPRRRVMGWYV